MGTYQTTKNGQSQTVHFTNGDVLKDVADLYALIEGEYKGTDSMESQQLKSMLGNLQTGRPLADSEWAALARIRAKYASQLDGFRGSSENPEEGYVPAPAPGSGRIMEALRMLSPSLVRAATEIREAGNAGNASHLIDWWNGGAGGQISWGSPGDFDDCVSLAGKYVADPQGFCQERHIDATGHPAGHAPGEQKTSESAPVDPPGLRDSTDPAKQCGNCKMYWKGKCGGWWNKPVRENQVCDTWTPELKEAQAREDTGQFMAGSRVFDPRLVNADSLHAAEAADHLVNSGRIRIAGQSVEAQTAASNIVGRVGDRAAVRTMAVKGNPYTQLKAMRETDKTDPKIDLPTVCIDFDGVIHEGPHGLPGLVEGDMVKGAAAGLKQLSANHKIVCLTARTDFGAVRRWLDEQGVGQYVDEVTNIKPAAAAYIDDRAQHFTDWPSAVAAVDPGVAMVTKTTLKPVSQTDPASPIPTAVKESGGTYTTPSTTTQDKATTPPHLLDTVLHDLAHANQHVQRLYSPDVKANAKSRQFNAEHADHHLQSALEHAKKLDAHLSTNASDPAVWQTERDALKSMRESDILHGALPFLGLVEVQP